MTTHRRAWIQRAGVVVALAASAIFALPAPPAAAAPPPDVRVDGSSFNIEAGGDVTVTVKITTKGDEDKVTVSLTGLPSGVTCAGGCGEITVEPQSEKNHLLTLKAAANAPAKRDQRVTVRAVTASNAGTASFSLTVIARPQEKPTVKSISGKVTNSSDGSGVPGADVGIKDSDDNFYSTTTDSNGNFRFTGSQSKPIAPGPIQIGAVKGDARKSLTVTLGPNAEHKTTIALDLGEPTPSPSESVEPTPDETEELEEEPTDEASTAPPNNLTQSRPQEDSGGGMSLLLILIGGLLVALGVGAIVLLLMRRKDGDDEADDEEEAPPARSRAPVAGGGYLGEDDPTRVATGIGADPTMVAPRSPIADAPTAMLGPGLVKDEYADPYGAPMPPPRPQAPTYGGGDPGWAGTGYGNAPSSGGGYGADGPGGYGNAPTQGRGGYGDGPSSGAGGYGGAPMAGSSYGGYGETPGGYGDRPSSGAGGYGDRPSSGAGYGGYGDGPSSGAGGYGSGPGGYGGAPTAGGGYGGAGGQYGPEHGGSGPGGYEDRYDEPTSRYDQGGYNRPAYGPTSGGGHGYGDDAGYQSDPRPSHGTTYGSGTTYGGSGSTYGGPSAGSGYAGGGDGYGASPGYDDRGGYGPGPGGYPAAGGYDEPGGYGRSGYDRVPEQRGGYPGAGYDQGGSHYGGPADDDPRHGGSQPPTRSERRPLGWLDD